MDEKSIQKQIPKEVSRVTKTLHDAGFEAYLVGGCIRDLIMDRSPKDWDITTNATPKQIISLFENTFYENNFGTVGVVNDDVEKSDSAHVIEVTPYRIETTYSDNRRPDEVQFSTHIEDDLKRRDFTINAIAYNPHKGHLVDLYKGQEDIKDKVVRTVGNPEERFGEDALRILRAIRISSEIGFTINVDTQKAIKKHSGKLKNISLERIRDEFSRMIDSPHPMEALQITNKLGVLRHISPELAKGIGVKQNGIHIYDVWEHNLRSVQHAANKGYAFHVKLSALFHDVAKPNTARWSKENNDWTFYGHDVVGERVTRETLKRLKFSRETIDIVSKLVRNHMFFSDVEKITLSAVRRIVANVGKDYIWDLVDLRTCDRIGTGRPKETPYRLRKYKSMIEEAMRAPVSVGMLKIDGSKIMNVTRETPGLRIGLVLHSLLEEVLDDPKLNTVKYLEGRAIELIKLPIEELQKLGDAGKEKKDVAEEEELKKIRKKHWVK